MAILERTVYITGRLVEIRRTDANCKEKAKCTGSVTWDCIRRDLHTHAVWLLCPPQMSDSMMECSLK